MGNDNGLILIETFLFLSVAWAVWYIISETYRSMKQEKEELKKEKEYEAEVAEVIRRLEKKDRKIKYLLSTGIIRKLSKAEVKAMNINKIKNKLGYKIS